MPSLISNEQVRLLVTDLFGGVVGRVKRLQGSVANQNFLIEYGSEPRLVLKAGPVAEIAAEAGRVHDWRASGFPCPA